MEDKVHLLKSYATIYFFFTPNCTKIRGFDKVEENLHLSLPFQITFNQTQLNVISRHDHYEYGPIWLPHFKGAGAGPAAFVTPLGLYEFRGLLLGLCNSPTVFQKLMNRVIA